MLLKPASNGTAFLKLGVYGFQGSGKTFTSVEFALGMCKLTKKNKVAFFDTEKGSDFHIQRFKDAGVELHVLKSRAFKDLLQVIREAEQNDFGFLIIDSVTHVWRELCDSYLAAKVERMKKFHRGGRMQANLTMKDWMSLKTEWAQFTDLFVNSNLHIAALGRAGYDYDVSEDDEGKQEIVKSGTKMKAEGEFGYESDLLLEMYKVPVAEVTKNKKAKGFTNRCIILKDRTDTMNAMSIDKPKFDDFQPIISFLNIGGEHVGNDPSRTSEDLFDNPGMSLEERRRRHAIALEELQEILILNGLDGTSSQAKSDRTKLLIDVFKTSSKTFLEEKIDLEILQAGVREIRQRFPQQSPSAPLELEAFPAFVPQKTEEHA